MSKGFNTEIKLTFKNKQGDERFFVTDLIWILKNSEEDAIEHMEERCTESSCNSESQNFCDCPATLDDYELAAIEVN
jgi:hypothetical protein